MIVLHIPHASTYVPRDVRSQFLISDDELADELRHMTDHATDLLFCGTDVASLVHGVSRLVVDPERFAKDADEPMAERGMGAVYTHGYRGTRIRGSLSPVEREHLMDEWYHPHHERLSALVQTALEREGRCTIMDCHSFASAALPYEPDQAPDRPEICLGTDPFHTPSELVGRLAHAFRGFGYSVEIDRPYAGTIVPAEYYRHDGRVRSIMIEVRRDLYLWEDTGALNERYARVRQDVRRVIGLVEQEE